MKIPARRCGGATRLAVDVSASRSESRRHEERKMSTAVHAQVRGAQAAVALSLLAITAPPAHAQSVQDRITQLQGSVAQLQNSLAQLHASFNAFASDTTSRLSAIAAQLAPPTAPVALSTGVERRPTDHFGECTVLNVGASAGNVRIRLMRSDGTELAASTNTVQPNQATGISQILGSPAASVWCRFEPQVAGMQLRASLNITNPVTGMSVVAREAR
jgi:hypothetical protein